MEKTTGTIKRGNSTLLISTRFFQVTLWVVSSDLFRGENVTSIWVIKRSRMEEAGTCTLIESYSGDEIGTRKQSYWNGIGVLGRTLFLEAHPT